MTILEPDTDGDLLSGLAECEALAAAVASLQSLDLSSLEPRLFLLAIRDVERLRRQLDAGTDRLVDHCDTTGAYVEDGYRSTAPCLKHSGRLSGPESHRRVQTARRLRVLPAVAAAYQRGEIPTEMVRAIARIASNPRVEPLLEIADPVFAEQASVQDHDAFIDWLARWEALADADGSAEASQLGHERRDARVWRNDIDGTVHLEAHTGGLQGAVMADIFDAFVAAELEADLAWAKEHLGEDFAWADLPRTNAQRRADALFAIFCRAMAQPADARNPEPLVNIVIDEETLAEEIRRTARGTTAPDDANKPAEWAPSRVDDMICHTTAGARLHPSDVIAALIVGHVRRVVVGSASNVIDVGRKRRLFTGIARDAAILQAIIRDRGGTGCRWPGCEAHHRRLQVDHRLAWTRGGPTSPDNSDLHCGVHNRLKETGFTPVRGPDGTWTILRPDDTPITPPA